MVPVFLVFEYMSREAESKERLGLHIDQDIASEA